jgi:hypothetical protein
MLGHLRKPAAAAIALCVLAWLPRSGQASHAQGVRTSSTSLLGGVNIGSVARGSTPEEADRAITVARQLHSKVVRIEIPWSVMEPAAPNDVEPAPLAYVDRLAKDAAAKGIKIIMTVDSTPCWATSAPLRISRRCTSHRSGPANAWPPRQPASYAAFVAYLAARYGTQLAAIEIWNEPDQINQQYFAGPHKAERYAPILRAAYRAIKQANPNVRVLGGSLVGSNGVFLRALYSTGIKGYYDGLAVHFYDLTLASLRAIHEVQLAHGDTTPLWLDEFGWSSCWPRYKIQQEQACVTRQLQGSNLADLISSIADVPYVSTAVVYKLQGSVSEDFGVLNSGGARKPAFKALAATLAAPLTRGVSAVTLSLRQSGREVLATGAAPPGDYMRLEVLQGGLLRFWAAFTLDRFNRYSIRLPSQLGTTGLTVRIFQYWSGVPRAAQRSI